jgi:hypothetical protein
MALFFQHYKSFKNNYLSIFDNIVDNIQQLQIPIKLTNDIIDDDDDQLMNKFDNYNKDIKIQFDSEFTKTLYMLRYKYCRLPSHLYFTSNWTVPSHELIYYFIHNDFQKYGDSLGKITVMTEQIYDKYGNKGLLEYKSAPHFLEIDFDKYYHYGEHILDQFLTKYINEENITKSLGMFEIEMEPNETDILSPINKSINRNNRHYIVLHNIQKLPDKDIDKIFSIITRINKFKEKQYIIIINKQQNLSTACLHRKFQSHFNFIYLPTLITKDICTLCQYIPSIKDKLEIYTYKLLSNYIDKSFHSLHIVLMNLEHDSNSNVIIQKPGEYLLEKKIKRLIVYMINTTKNHLIVIKKVKQLSYLLVYYQIPMGIFFKVAIRNLKDKKNVKMDIIHQIFAKYEFFIKKKQQTILLCHENILLEIYRSIIYS